MRPKKDFSKEPAWLRINDDQSDRSKNDDQTDQSKTDEQTEGSTDKDPAASEEIVEESESKPKKPLSGKEKKRLRTVELIYFFKLMLANKKTSFISVAVSLNH